MEQLTQFVSKSFEEGTEPRGTESWSGSGPPSSRGSVSPLVDPEDSRSEPSTPPIPQPSTSPNISQNGEIQEGKHHRKSTCYLIFIY